MSQPSNLPAVRPTTGNYGPDLSNARPIKNPLKELDAGNWNQIKADAAQIAQTAALTLIYYRFASDTFHVAGIDGSLVTQTDHDVSSTEVTISPSADLAIQFAFASANDAAAQVTGVHFVAGSNVVRVFHSTATDFSLWVG